MTGHFRSTFDIRDSSVRPKGAEGDLEGISRDLAAPCPQPELELQDCRETTCASDRLTSLGAAPVKHLPPPVTHRRFHVLHILPVPNPRSCPGSHALLLHRRMRGRTSRPRPSLVVCALGRSALPSSTLLKAVSLGSRADGLIDKAGTKRSSLLRLVGSLGMTSGGNSPAQALSRSRMLRDCSRDHELTRFPTEKHNSRQT